MKKAKLLRVYLKSAESGLTKMSDILVDQVCSIDDKRLTKKLGSFREKLELNLGLD